MTHTQFRDNHAEIVQDIAYGYKRTGDSFELSIPNFDTVGATSLLTTVEDLARWDENFYSHILGGAALAAQLEERGRLNDGTSLNYAGGLEINRYRGQKLVEHSGGDAGYRAHLARFPDQHFSVALTCNIAESAPAVLAAGSPTSISRTHWPPVAQTGVPVLAPQPGEEQFAQMGRALHRAR